MAEHSEITARRRVMRERIQRRRELSLFMRRLGSLMIAMAVLIAAGTLAYALTEGTSIAYGFIWTLDTVTTLGTIPDPKDAAGRIVTVGLELLGIGTLFYGLATVAEFFVSGQLSGLLDERRTQKMVDSYSEHFIVCGFGRVGRQVVRDLRIAGAKHVVIDENHEHRELADALGVRYIEGSAADDEVLQQAGIERAAAVIACVDSDADNIFIALTARELRSDILIIARASAEDSEKKLLRAGADRVISPYKTSGAAMARVALHPQVGGAFEVADYRMEEIEVSPSCQGVGQTVEHVRGDSVIVALRRSDGRLEPQPSPDLLVEAGDMLVALGTPDALGRLEVLFQPASVTNA
ncbi:MAG: TrkA family potassium uptake protein [Actinomycetota bacterium]|nr:TrkA family potassium uptake protein [Actinomycetota bacterium]